MNALPNRPDKYGSSDKNSKFRPFKGVRLMFTPGAKSTSVPFIIQSSAINSPSQRKSSSFHVLPILHEQGKLTPFSVPSAYNVLTPQGPSHIKSSFSFPFAPYVCHISLPVSRFNFSSNVKSFTVIFMITFLPLREFYLPQTVRSYKPWYNEAICHPSSFRAK